MAMSVCDHPAARNQGRWNRLVAWIRARRPHHQQLPTGQRALRDVGLSNDRACAEAARPVWDVPQNWRI